MTGKETVTELHFLLAEINALDCTEMVKERYREAVRKAIYAIEREEQG